MALTGKSSIADWLAHPIGGPMLTKMVADAGQDVSVFKPVRRFALARLVPLSRGAFTMDAVDAMVAQVRAAEAAAGGADYVAPEDDDSEVTEWVEKITPGRFEGKTVIVTGAGSGIGRATASRIAREGGRVIAADVSKERLAELVKDLKGFDVVSVIGDISNEKDIAAVVKAAKGKVDSLANIAGISDNMTALHDVTDQAWERIMRINVEGTFKLTRAVIPVMLAAGKGTIVNITSEAGLRGNAAGFAYTASKHAVVGMTRSAAFTYGQSGIRVNAVAPGGVATNIEATMQPGLGLDRIAPFLEFIPSVVDAPALAATITFLLSDDSENVNGAILPSDGGWSVQ
jgi:NAD(P)-dependent dehydrogenase (short-subunit alcohol dehydrogenase family)